MFCLSCIYYLILTAATLTEKKKVKSIKDSKLVFNGSITGFSEPGARKIFITLTESGRERKVTKSDFDTNLDIIDTNKKSIKTEVDFIKVCALVDKTADYTYSKNRKITAKIVEDHLNSP